MKCRNSKQLRAKKNVIKQTIRWINESTEQGKCIAGAEFRLNSTRLALGEGGQLMSKPNFQVRECVFRRAVDKSSGAMISCWVAVRGVTKNLRDALPTTHDRNDGRRGPGRWSGRAVTRPVVSPNRADGQRPFLRKCRLLKTRTR